MKAPDFLDRGAKEMRDRAALRDSPEGERSMKAAVAAFNAIFGTNLTETQGWLFMTILKISRASKGKFSQDDYVDMAAYSALAGESAHPLANPTASINLVMSAEEAEKYRINPYYNPEVTK